MKLGAGELAVGALRGVGFRPEGTRPVVKGHVSTGDVDEAAAAGLLGRVEGVLGAGNVRPAEVVRVRSWVGDAGGVDESVATGGGCREAVRLAEVTDEALDIAELARVGAFADVRDDFVPGGSKPSEHASPDEAGRPRYQTAHVRLVTGCAGDTKGTSGGSLGRG